MCRVRVANGRRRCCVPAHAMIAMPSVCTSDFCEQDGRPQEEGEYEYASYYPSVENDKTEEAHVEPALLYQPLNGEDEQSGAQRREVKGGPGICQKHCSRAHHIWSHAKPEHWEEDCAKGVAGYMLLATPADAANPAGDVAGCAVGVLLGKI